MGVWIGIDNKIVIDYLLMSKELSSRKGNNPRNRNRPPSGLTQRVTVIEGIMSNRFMWLRWIISGQLRLLG
jgi:hypothetical protein